MATEHTLNPHEAHLTASADFIPEPGIMWGRDQWVVLLVLLPLVLFAPTPVFAALDLLVVVGLLLMKGYDDLFDKMRVTFLGTYVVFSLVTLYELWGMTFLDNLTLAIMCGITLPNLVAKLRG